jgi:UDP-GlcNAc:undecaprenyl-phosphate GlcNAc-1-phosphate transferase
MRRTSFAIHFCDVAKESDMTPIFLLGAFLLTISALMLLRPAAKKLGLVDTPGGRKTHSEATPMVGGLGIYLGLLAVYIMSPLLLPNYQDLLILSGAVLIFGVIDDAVGLSPMSRLALHGGIALGMAFIAGIRLETFGNLLGSGPIYLGALSVPITVFATIGVINAVNMSDGLDGLSGGLAVIAFTALALCSMLAGEGAMMNFSIVLIIQVLAFLTLNLRSWWNKRVLMFLGDSGSTLLGFLLAWILIDSSQGSQPVIQPVHALWFFALPLIDTVSLLIRRPLSGKSAFTPGLDHFHHRLIRAGYSRKKAVLIMYGLASIFASIGVISNYVGLDESVMFWLFMLIFGLYMLATKEQAAQETA